jgi:hypothetical protein
VNQKLKTLKEVDWVIRRKLAADKAAQIFENVPSLVHKNHIVRKNIGTPENPVLGPENGTMVSYSDKYRMHIANSIGMWHLEKNDEALIEYAKRHGVRDACEILLTGEDGSGVVLTFKQKVYCLDEQGKFIEF